MKLYFEFVTDLPLTGLYSNFPLLSLVERTLGSRADVRMKRMMTRCLINLLQCTLLTKSLSKYRPSGGAAWATSPSAQDVSLPCLEHSSSQCRL
mgnify:CR=1 FL=1